MNKAVFWSFEYHWEHQDIRFQSKSKDCKSKDKVSQLHAMEAHGVRGDIAPTHS
jgi:hypothetical protein